MKKINARQIDFDKNSGLVPAVIQDYQTQQVLMLGFMNKQAFSVTQKTKKVTFYSRTKKRLWTKGESSGNYLLVQSIALDCDKDTLLIQAKPTGPVCHTGDFTCFAEQKATEKNDFLSDLRALIHQRRIRPSAGAYSSKLFKSGVHKIAQKVGEEAVEVVIEALRADKKLLREESADLLFHFCVLLEATGVTWEEVLSVLSSRNQLKEGK